MFESEKKWYTLYAVDTAKDEYRQESGNKVEVGRALVFICTKSHSPYIANDLRMQQITHVGLTRAKEVKRGMYVGDFLVEFVDSGGSETILYLKEVV